MASTALEVAWAGWVITVVGWLLSPVIALLLPKIISRLVFDATNKLRELDIHIIPELQQTLRAVDQERMLGRGKKLKSDVDALDKMAAMLRHAREDAEDIFDDAHHKVVTRCCHHLYTAMACVWIILIRSSGLAYLGILACLVRLLQRVSRWCEEVAQAIEDRAASQENVEANDTSEISHEKHVVVTIHAGASHEQALVPVAVSGSASHEQALVPVATPSGSYSYEQAPVPESATHEQALVPVAMSSESASQEQSIVPESAYHEQALVPVAMPSESASQEQALVLESASHEQALVPVAMPSESALQEQALLLESASDEQALVPEATPSVSASNQQAFVPEATPSTRSASNEQALVPVATPSESASEAIPLVYYRSVGIEIPTYNLLGWRCLNVFKNRCRSIFYWLFDAFEGACFCRNWSYEVVGITSNQEDATALDCVLTAISRWNLKKRIEKVESTINEVKKSPLLGVTSKSAPDDIANKNRSRIRSASNRMVFGREELLDFIMEKLHETPHYDATSWSTSPCYSVIGIYGIAGSGKTTFARYTRDHIKHREPELFDTVICIHVSETFSVDDIFREMLRDITQNRQSNISDHDELEVKLKESLRDKRFFLILDDLWVKTKNDSHLEELIAPLNVGLRGSKILVTARTKDAAGALCANEPIEMPDLDGDQYLSMFMHYALGGTSVVDEEFTQVGRVIAEKLHGSPIAAVIVAGRLGANRDIRFWKNIAELDMLNDIMDSLWWSYQQLSSDIRRCFEYCSIFPRRCRMEKDDLIHLLIAQGFVKTNCARQNMEDVVEIYIQELVSYSFLQQEEDVDGIFWFTIHDLLHDLVDMVTRTDFSTIENEISRGREGWKEDVPRGVRHLFVQNYDAELITEKILVLENLRTLIIYNVEHNTPVEEKVIESICKRLQKLRVLAIGTWMYSSFREPKQFVVPQSISRLRHIRHFAFRVGHFSMVILPYTLTELQHIQLLDFHHGDISNFNLDELPNLRHIFCLSGVKLADLRKLTSLQTLQCELIVRNEQGYGVNQLRDLNNLRGKLEINGLGNVKSKEEALEANLATKVRVTDLRLKWEFTGDTRCSPEVEADVLESLCPPVGLEVLHVHGYKGSRYPDWMVGYQNGGPKYLQWIDLWDWSQLGPAPQLVEAFPHLRLLRFWHCSWDALPGNMEHLTSLNELYIVGCKNIRSLPTLPQSLYEFRLSVCDIEFMESCKREEDPNWYKIEHVRRKVID